MRATVLYGKEDIRLEEIETPQPAIGELVVEVRAAFICGTDVRMYRNGNPQAKFPVAPGHELSGVVVAVGAGVRGFSEGDRVAIAPNIGCGQCDMCASGNTYLCAAYRAVGIHMHGGFAQYIRIPAPFLQQGNVIKIDERIDFAGAALAEPLSCVYNAYSRSGVTKGSIALVVGAGPIGLLHARLAKMGGARVIINDLDKQRLAICARLDPDLIIAPDGALRDVVRDVTKGRGVDVCITACPSPQAQIEALELAGVNGRIIFFGGLPRGRSTVALDTNLIHYKQLYVTGTTRASVAHFKEALRLIRENLIDVKSLVTATYRLDDVPEALKSGGRPEALKSLIANFAA